MKNRRVARVAGKKAYRAQLAWLGVLAMLLQGCNQPMAVSNVNNTAPITTFSHVKINGVDYSSPAAALAAQQHGNDSVLAALNRERDPIRGRVRIVLPDHDRLRPLIAQGAQQVLKRAVIGAALDFLIDESRQNLHQLANAIVHNGAFDSATIVEQNDVVEPAPGNANFIVWYEVRQVLPNNMGPWIGIWRVRHVGNPATLGAAVDQGTAPGAPQLASFVKSVRAAALRLGGTSVAGATAASLPTSSGGAPASSGSGIVVDTAGDVVTNEHVVRACATPRVFDARNAGYPAHIVASDATNDLALLKVEHHWAQPASFRDGSEPRQGEPVIVTGYPLPSIVGPGMSMTNGSVTALAGPRGDSRLMQISAPVQPGNSGGPLLDANGQIAGVVVSTLNGMVLAMMTGMLPQNVNFAIKTDIVRGFLDSEGVHYAHAANAHEMSPADIGERARKFTVHVTCGGV